MAVKKLYIDLDLNKQKLTNYLSNPLTTAARTALVLTAADKGYEAYDTTELRDYTWNGTAWIAEYQNPMTTLGDLVSGGASGAAGRLGIGSTGQVLTVASGVASWANSAAGFSNPMTAVGDLIVGGTAGAGTRLAIGTTGQILTSTGTTSSWATVADRNAIVTLTFAAAQTWATASSENAVVTLTANMTGLTITGAIAGHCYTLMLIQDATGSRLATFGASFKWVGGTVPTLSTAAASRDIVVFYYDGTNYNGILNKAFA